MKSTQRVISMVTLSIIAILCLFGAGLYVGMNGQGFSNFGLDEWFHFLSLLTPSLVIIYIFSRTIYSTLKK